MPSSATPAIDVILSTYNGADYVRAAVDSVLGQTFEDFRLHIVDDASRDSTWDLVAAYDDPRIVRARNPRNLGLFANINRLAAASAAPLVKLLGQDDVLEPECLARGHAFHLAHPQVGYFWCYSRYIDERGAFVGGDDLSHATGPLDGQEAALSALRWGCLSANISNMFLTRQALRAAGPFREDIMSADFEMMTRVQRTHQLARLVEPLARIRKHAGQWSSDLHAMENQIAGNCAAFRNVLDHAVVEAGLVSPALARRTLLERLARYEFDWTVKALVKTGQVGGFWRSVARMSRLAPLAQLAPAWGWARLQRTLARAGGARP